MALAHPDELPPRVHALFADTGALATAAGLGFVAEKKEIGDAAVRAVVAQTAWQSIDLRGVAVADARARIEKALQSGKGKKPLVVVVDGTAPMPAVQLAKAMADRRHGGNGVADLGAGVHATLPKDFSMVVVVDGIVDHAALPTGLQNVDFWEWLR